MNPRILLSAAFGYFQIRDLRSPGLAQNLVLSERPGHLLETLRGRAVPPRDRSCPSPSSGSRRSPSVSGAMDRSRAEPSIRPRERACWDGIHPGVDRSRGVVPREGCSNGRARWSSRCWRRRREGRRTEHPREASRRPPTRVTACRSSLTGGSPGVLHLKGPLQDLDDSGPTPYRVGEGTGGHHDNGEQGEVPALEVAERRGARRLAKIWTRWRTQRPERHAGGMSQYN